MTSHVLQIIHEPTILGATEAEMEKGLANLKAQGIGGVVTNVSFTEYFENDKKWQEFADFIRACRKTGMRIWLYDERGYPSGTAGGRVLHADPDLEAKALAWDGASIIDDRPYEKTHACHNYHERRRYINMAEKQATAKFIELTHDVYCKKMQNLGWPVEAFFTDEPALNVLNVGRLPDDIESKLPVHDQPDPNKKRLPMIAWSDEVARLFDRNRAKPVLVDAPDSKTARREYYDAVAECVSDLYFGQIQDWCREHHTLSSGHLLGEEDILGHPALYGNALRCLMRMDVPGMDLLDADPERAVKHQTRAALLASSAAMLNGTRRIMTEVSDFSQIMDQQRLATVPEAQATAAWQAALGVTEFTVYYSWGDFSNIPHPVAVPGKNFKFRTPEEYLAINTLTSELVDQLEPASLIPDVFLYYPIELVQEGFVPSDLSLWEMNIPPRLVEVRDAFNRAMDHLIRVGAFVCLVDGRMIQSAQFDRTGIQILNAKAKTILYPERCAPPKELFPPDDCPMYELKPDTVRKLFDIGKLRLLNLNPNVLVTVMETEGEYLFTCVNLKNEPQTADFRTVVGNESFGLKPYESKLLKRAKKQS